ncbi:30S ribosomal protein S18 [Candidatus Oleimmundimicrobium sp.]|uniref:30S ribosomal protein S18 n=1 Tax=Candidatus Oleimmundimicrobium sp. TaxID=3060597 RepID=UPI0030149BBD
MARYAVKKNKDDKKEKSNYFFRKHPKKVCFFCKEKIDYIDYKDLNLLRRFMNDKSKIKPKRVTGTCVQHQSKLATAIKRAREMALIKYSVK